MDVFRVEYDNDPFDVADVDPDPFTQWRRWFAEATAVAPEEPNAMVLATADAAGVPTARVVLLKGLDSGFIFYTNRQSQKGRQLEENPQAALCFHWPLLHRQVRVEGQVESVEDSMSDVYFESRPEGARIGAAASPQSQVIPDRGWLEERVSQMAEGGVPPRPPHWGGYRVCPVRIEFWQGRLSRLHDRISYRKLGDDWIIERLAP